MVHRTNHSSILLLPARCLCTNPFSPTSLYTSPRSGYKESSYQQMDWGELGSFAQGGCRAHLCSCSSALSVFLSLSVSFVVCFIFLLPTLCYHQLQLCQQQPFIVLFVLVGRLWGKDSVVKPSFLPSDSASESSSGPHLARPSLHVGPSGKCLLRRGIQPCPPSLTSQLFSVFLSCVCLTWFMQVARSLGQDTFTFLCVTSMQLDTDFLVLQQCELRFGLGSAGLQASSPSVLLPERAVPRANTTLPVGRTNTSWFVPSSSTELTLANL